jgi:hypothetical protein
VVALVRRGFVGRTEAGVALVAFRVALQCGPYSNVGHGDGHQVLIQLRLDSSHRIDCRIWLIPGAFALSYTSCISRYGSTRRPCI